MAYHEFLPTERVRIKVGDFITADELTYDSHIYYYESSFLFSATSTTLKVLFYFLPHLLL
jgi:hypothetical protein